MRRCSRPSRNSAHGWPRIRRSYVTLKASAGLRRGGTSPVDGTISLSSQRDSRLEEANALVREPRFGPAEGSVEQGYLHACLAAQHARDGARRKRIRTTIGALLAGLLYLGGCCAVGRQLQHNSGRATRGV